MNPNTETVDPLTFESSTKLNEESKKDIAQIRVNEAQTEDLEKELKDLKMSNSYLMKTTAQQAANYEELRAADKKEIKLLLQTIQNLQEELEKEKSQNEVLRSTMKCNKCQQLGNVQFTLDSRIAAEKSDDDEKDVKNSQMEEGMLEEKGKKMKYIVVNYNYNFHDLYVEENVEFVDFDDYDDLRFLREVATCYHKEMFVIANHFFLNPTSGWPAEYSNLLSICRHWKNLRPDGEIHAIGWYEKYQDLCDLTEEMRSVFTTYNTLQRTIDQYRDFPVAIARNWSKHYHQLLREELKQKYLQ